MWNPGELPPGLTPELLRLPHGAIPRNPLIAEPLFRVQYAEKAGTGTTDMIADFLNAGLPEPNFRQCGPHFVVTLWRDWLTDEIMEQFDLDDRQKQSVLIAKKGVQISNKDYRVKFRVSKSTASRDLDSLVSKGIFEKVGTTGKGTYYMLSGKGLIKGSKGSPGDAETQTAHKGLKGLIPDRDEAEKTGNTQGAISGKTTQETTQEKILACLIDSPTLTRRALASNIGITEDGIKYHLAKLTKAKLIRHIGSTKTGHWEILK